MVLGKRVDANRVSVLDTTLGTSGTIERHAQRRLEGTPSNKISYTGDFVL